MKKCKANFDSIEDFLAKRLSSDLDEYLNARDDVDLFATSSQIPLYRAKRSVYQTFRFGAVIASGATVLIALVAYCLISFFAEEDPSAYPENSIMASNFFEVKPSSALGRQCVQELPLAPVDLGMNNRRNGEFEYWSVFGKQKLSDFTDGSSSFLLDKIPYLQSWTTIPWQFSCGSDVAFFDSDIISVESNLIFDNELLERDDSSTSVSSVMFIWRIDPMVRTFEVLCAQR